MGAGLTEKIKEKGETVVSPNNKEIIVNHLSLTRSFKTFDS
jgi:hypothetical protein